VTGVSSGGVNAMADTMGQASASKEQQMVSFQASMDQGSSQDMIKLQNLTQQWSLMVNLQSTLMKLVGDALKGIVQKVG
jgi:type III secretion protein F